MKDLYLAAIIFLGATIAIVSIETYTVFFQVFTSTMNKFSLWIKGYAMCLTWAAGIVWEFVVEHCVEIRFWEGHNNFDDHIWYAERVNGRLAMLVLSLVLILELVSHDSIWHIVYGY